MIRHLVFRGPKGDQNVDNRPKDHYESVHGPYGSFQEFGVLFRSRNEDPSILGSILGS